MNPNNGQSLRMSATVVAQLAHPDACARCFWLRRRVNNQLPFDIFPGIFYAIDASTKLYVHAHLEEFGQLPDSLRSIGGGKINRYCPNTRVGYEDPDSGIFLTGIADDFLMARNDDIHLVDYKTARYTDTQKELFPKYVAQLNIYAYAGMRSKSHPSVKSLALIYYEPMNKRAGEKTNRTPDGFRLPFDAQIVPVALDLDMIPPLLQKARRIIGLKNPPPSQPGCKDCLRLANLFAVAPPPPEHELAFKLEQSIARGRALKRRDKAAGKDFDSIG
jgi:hypothetical protein